MTERETSGRGRQDAKGSGSPGMKKAYVQPKLIEYGSISKLSAAKPGGTNEGPLSSQMRPMV
jgi:hypothetical protein